MLATSVLAVGQDAASSAAHESTTGNLSLANTSQDTHRFATMEGRQIRTSAHVDTDRYTGYAPAGAGFTVTGDGTVVADAGAATSRIPAAGVRLSESLATSHENRASEARTFSRHWSAEAGMARNAAVTDATQMVERYSHDVNTGEAYARGVTESESNQAQALESHVEKMSEAAGITRSEAATLTGEAKVGGGWDFIVKIGADGSATWRGQTMGRESWERMKDYAEQHQVLDLWSRVSDASRRYSTATGESEMASLDESLSANLTRMRRFEERASLSRQESESWSEQAAQVRSDAQAVERELGQPFFSWLSEREGADGRPIGAAGAMRIASPQTPEDSEALREHAAAFIAERFPAPAGADPATIGGEAEYGAARNTLSDSYARETAAAHGGWAEGVRDRAYVAGAPIPGEVEAAALGERAGTKADMMVGEAGRGARTGLAQQKAREGRAGVAVEVEKPIRAPRHRERAGGRRVARGQALRHREECRAGRGAGRGTGWDGPPRPGRARLAGPVAVSGSAQMVVVVQAPVFLFPHPCIGAGPRFPVEPLAAAVGKLVAAEGRPVSVPETPPERAREAGEHRPGEGREPQRAEMIRARACGKRGGGCQRGDGKRTQHEGACAPGAAAAGLRRCSCHGHALQVYAAAIGTDSGTDRAGEAFGAPLTPVPSAPAPAGLDLRAPQGGCPSNLQGHAARHLP